MPEDPFDQPILPDPSMNGSYGTPDIASVYQAFKSDQDNWLKQQQAQTEQFAQQKEQAQARGQDLDIASRMYKVFDPNINPKVRKFLLDETAQYVGADTKGDRYKGVSQMINGLDPDTMSSMKQLFAEKLKDATPGQIKETINGILTGQVSMSSFVDEVGKMQMAQDAKRQEDMNNKKVVAPYQEGQPSAVQSFEGQRTIPPNAAQASPQLVGALGLDSTKTYRNSDLIKHGYRIPLDAKDQEKLAGEVNTQSVGVSSLLNDSAKLVQLFEGRPEVLGTVGSASQYLQGTIRQVQGALKMVGAEDISNPYSDEIQGTLKSVTDNLQKRGILGATAEDASRVQAMVLSLAYRMSQAENIPGNRLTNAIIQQHLMQIGNSSSPEQFKAVLRDAVEGTVRQFDENIRRTLGSSGLDIVTRQMTDADISTLSTGAVGKDGQLTGPVSILPKSMARALLDEAVRRREGAANPNQIEPAGPTIEQEQNTLGQLETQGKQRKMNKEDEEMRLAREKDERAKRQEQLANEREQRTTEIAQGHLTLAQKNYELAVDREVRAEQHQKEQAAQHQRDKISAAFQKFGEAIAHSYHGASVGSGGGGGGPGQNEAAFRITPAPQRVPPRPPGK